MRTEFATARGVSRALGSSSGSTSTVSTNREVGSIAACTSCSREFGVAGGRAVVGTDSAARNKNVNNRRE